jgi:hypothetical protein
MSQGRPASIDVQLQASRPIADAIIRALTNERGVHAETAVVAAARMAGTLLFRTFGLPARNIEPGTPVFSDVANERGPVLVEVLQAGLSGMGVDASGPVSSEQVGEHPPQLALLEMQHAIEPAVTAIAASHGLEGESAARACALATAVLIDRTKSVLAPSISVRLAVDGFVESTKTMPLPLSGPPAAPKPWYKLW